jgi:hypothetical protein
VTISLQALSLVEMAEPVRVRFTLCSRDQQKTTQCPLSHGPRTTSHTRLRARDHHNSSTLIGGNSRARPSLLHTTLEGLMENNTVSTFPRTQHHSHMRLRARGHYNSSILIGGNGRAGLSSLHTTLEGPTENNTVSTFPLTHGHFTHEAESL